MPHTAHEGTLPMTYVTLAEAQSQLPELIAATQRGEKVVITLDKMPAVQIVPIAEKRGKPVFGSAKGLINMADDFDEPLEDFAEYM